MFSSLFSLLFKNKKQREMQKKGLIGSRKRQKQEETFSHVADKSKVVGIVILLLVWATSVTVLMLPQTKSEYYPLVPHQRSERNIYADIDFSYEDVEQTENDRARAKANVPLDYRIDEKKYSDCLKNADVVFGQIIEFAKENKSKAGDKGEHAGNVVAEPEKNNLPDALKPLNKKEIDLLSLLLKNKQQKEKLLENIRIVLLKGIISKKDKENLTYGQQIRVVDQRNRKRKPQVLDEILVPKDAAELVAKNMIKNYSPNNRDFLKTALTKLCETIVTSDLTFDKETTEKNKEIAAEKVKPTIINVKKGEMVLRKDKEVEKRDILRCDSYSKALKEKESTFNFVHKLVNYSFVNLILMVLTGLYIYHIHPEVVRSNQKMCLTATAVILSMFIIYGVVRLFNSITISSSGNIHPSLVQIIVPLGITSCLLSVLIGLRVAFYAGIFVSIIAAYMLGNSYHFVIIDGIAISCIAGFAVRKSWNYKSFFMRGWIAVSITTILVNYQQFWSIKGDQLHYLTWTLVFAIVNGLATGIFSLILIFILESIFNVSTDMSLILLCDYNHPLLKRLQFEAPGTYHHSLMVSTLAEQAAEVIGANPIKARVCALFHDIGKLSQPEYFIENNLAGENKHDELHPRMSSLVILNHVKEGIDMAIKYKLRKVIRDAIEQHHGTDLVKYFYIRAVEENKDKDTPVEEQEYRYPGPLPREKEVVLVSLADACEAASRTLQKPTPAKIEALIWELFRKRIRDRQLDAADLTFGELAKVRQSFVKSITTMLHGRVVYPKDKEDDEDENDLFKAAKKISESKKIATQDTLTKSDKTMPLGPRPQ